MGTGEMSPSTPGEQGPHPQSRTSPPCRKSHARLDQGLLSVEWHNPLSLGGRTGGWVAPGDRVTRRGRDSGGWVGLRPTPDPMSLSPGWPLGPASHGRVSSGWACIGPGGLGCAAAWRPRSGAEGRQERPWPSARTAPTSARAVVAHGRCTQTSWG